MERTYHSTLKPRWRCYCSRLWTMECRIEAIAKIYSIQNLEWWVATRDPTRTSTRCQRSISVPRSLGTARKIPSRDKWTNFWRRRWNLRTCLRIFVVGNRTAKFRCRVTERQKLLRGRADWRMALRKFWPSTYRGSSNFDWTKFPYSQWQNSTQFKLYQVNSSKSHWGSLRRHAFWSLLLLSFL